MKASSVFWLVIALCVVLTYAFVPGLIRFWPFTAAEFLQLVAPLLLVSLIIERTLEVFVTAWRGGEAARIELRVRLKKTKDAEARGVEEQELTTYKSQTQRIAFLAGCTLGVVVSALGIRALELFVDPAVFNSLSSVQRGLFNAVDVVLTGALIGGGSDGLHKLVSVFTDFLDKTRAKLKTP
jgi:hypothetical protein